jgi:hypothetical protein
MKAEITGAEEKFDFSNPQRPVKLYVVRYKTEAGSQGSVEILDKDYTPEYVAKVIAAELKRVHDVVGKTIG